MTDQERAEAEAVPEAPEMTVAPEPAVLELEFRMAVEDIPLLSHLPILAALRKGRISSVAEEIRWLDTPGGAVMGSGKLIEVPRRGPKRLVTLHPADDAPWHPGMVLPSSALPSPSQEQAAGGVEALIPLAAFSGRRRRQTLVLGDAVVQLRVLHGHLRTVMAEREVARVSLLGPPEAVLDLAQRLAAVCPLLPSSLSLAAEALSLATGQPPAPRRRGAPDTSGTDTLEACFTLAIGHLLEVASHYAPIARAGTAMEGVHQLRVAMRRLRSVLKVFRPVTDAPQGRALDEALQGFLKLLGPARDWDVFLAGIGAEMADLLPDDRRMRALLRAAEAERQTAYKGLAEALDGPAWRGLLLAGIAFLLHKPWRDGADPERLERLEAPPQDFAALVLGKRWRKLRKAGEDIEELEPAALHELRLDAKRLRYAAEVMAPIFPSKATRRFQRNLSALQEELGLSNDASVARGLVRHLDRDKDAGRAWAIGIVEGWCLARTTADREAILEIWDKLDTKESFWSAD